MRRSRLLKMCLRGKYHQDTYYVFWVVSHTPGPGV